MFYLRLVTFSQLALLNIIGSLTTMLLELPTGALADLLGRKTTIIIGLALSASQTIGIIFADNFIHLLLITIVAGVGSALVSGADSALLYDTLKQLGKESEFGKVVVKSGFYYRVGLIIGSFLGGFMFKMWIGLPYLMKGISILIGAAFVSLMVEPKIDSEKFSLKAYVKQTKQGFKEITKSSYMKKLALFYVLIGSITWSCLYYFNQPFALDFSFSAAEMSWLFGGVYLISTLILYIITSRKNWLSRQRVYLGFPLLMTLSYLPGLIVSRGLAPMLILGSQIAGSARFAILDKYTNKEFESKNRATALSSLNMLVELGFAGLLAVGGFVQEIHSTKMVYSLLGILTVVLVWPMALVLVRDNRNYLKNKAI